MRTLQYYDKCGLLIPEYSEGERRMYNRRDVMRPQQILYLKSFDFSLEDIRDRLLPVESAAEFERILTQQRQGLLDQISHLQQVAEAMNEVIAEIKASGDIETERFVAIMELMRQGILAREVRVAEHLARSGAPVVLPATIRSQERVRVGGLPRLGHGAASGTDSCSRRMGNRV